jgi:hypothetical protein
LPNELDRTINKRCYKKKRKKREEEKKRKKESRKRRRRIYLIFDNYKKAY